MILQDILRKFANYPLDMSPRRVCVDIGLRGLGLRDRYSGARTSGKV